MHYVALYHLVGKITIGTTNAKDIHKTVNVIILCY